MKKDLDYDKFRYWLISLDIFEKEPKVKDWKFERSMVDKYLQFHWSDGTPSGFRKIYILNDKQQGNDFSTIFIDFNKFLENKQVLTVGELKANSVSKLFSKKSDFSLWQKFQKLQRNLLLSFQSPELIGKDNQSIFYANLKLPYPDIHSPCIWYIEPMEGVSFLDNKKNISITKIRKFIKMFRSHEMLWHIMDNYVIMTFLFTEYPWKHFIFLNTNKIAKDDTDTIRLPRLIDYLLNQLSCYHWLVYRKDQILKSGLSTFNPKLLTSIKSLKDILRSHKKVLSSLGEFYGYNIKLLDELPLIKKFNSFFVSYLENKSILEPYAERFMGPSTLDRFHDDVSESLISLDQHISKLTSKSLMLSTFSRDMLNTKISKINLRLQWLLIILTIILALLTGIFALKSF